MRKPGKYLFIVFVIALPLAVSALENFECVLLVNARSQDSLEVGNSYARLREIPSENLIRLSIPEKGYLPPYSISTDEFKQMIFDPVIEEIDRRGLKSSIRAWIYSTDFPIRVETEDGATMSLQGMTLCAASPPPADAINGAAYLNPLYAGPGPENENLNPSKSFDRLIGEQDLGRVIPSMMLTFTGERGLTVEESKDVFRRGVIADGSAPEGTVYFINTSDSARSKPREWQFGPARDILAKSGVEAIVSNQFPRAAAGIIGLQTGKSSLDTDALGEFRAGAMAEHLTSWGACFDKPWHSKVTDWLRSGATASSGTVIEPFALWPKFPTAFFFCHYRSGCSMIESFFQSIRSPVQILLVGEPLARPWIRKASVTIVRLKDGPVSGRETFHARMLTPVSRNLQPSLSYYLDGSRLMTGDKSGRCGIDSEKVPDGHHVLRAVVETRGNVNVRPTGTIEFVVDNRGRVPQLRGISENQECSVGEELSIAVAADSEAEMLGVGSRGHVLAVAQENPAKLAFDPIELGAGKVPIQAFARYPDGEVCKSPPINILVTRPKSPPIETSAGKISSEPLDNPQTTDDIGEE